MMPGQSSLDFLPPKIAERHSETYRESVCTGASGRGKQIFGKYAKERERTRDSIYIVSTRVKQSIN